MFIFFSKMPKQQNNGLRVDKRSNIHFQQQQATGFMGNVGVIMRNACAKITKTEATNCLDHGLVFLL